MNLYDSYVLSKLSGVEDNHFEVINHPLPLQGVQRSGSLHKFIQVSNLSFTCLIISFSLICSGFTIYLTYEKRFQAHHLQVVSGVSKTTYYLANYAWDNVLYLLLCSCLFIPLFLLPVRAMYTFSSDAVMGVVLLFLLSGPANIGFAYIMQIPFQNEMVCFGAVLAMNAMAALLMFDVISILVGMSFPNLSSSQSITMQIEEVLEWIFPLLPSYALVRGLFEITWASFYVQYPIPCKSLFQCSVLKPLQKAAFPPLSRSLVYLGVESIVFISIFLLVELVLRTQNTPKKSVLSGTFGYICNSSEDRDVQK